MWLIFALLSGFGAAILAIITKIFLNNVNPLVLTFLFSIVAFLILLSLGIYAKKTGHYTGISSFSKKDWLFVVIAGSINCLAFIAYITALQYGRAANVVAVDRLGVLFVVIFSVIFLQETLTIQSVIGSLVMVGGAVLLSA